MFKLNFRFLSYFLLLLLVETAIALWIHDAFVRPFLGDFLATITLYMLIRGLTGISKERALFWSLLISYLIEGLQYVQFLSLINLHDHKLLSIVLGSYFHWGDMLAYTLGAAVVFIVHKQTQTV